MPTQTRQLINHTPLGAALLAGLLILGSGPVLAQPAKPSSTKAGNAQNNLHNWQQLDKEKDGSIYIRYDNPDPFSRVYTWRFRSTFDHPVHVDYRIDTNTRRGFPVELERTAYVPANGKTNRLGVPSYLQPNIIVERVR